DKEKVTNFLGYEKLYLKVNKENKKALNYVEKVQKFYQNKEYENVIKIYKELKGHFVEEHIIVDNGKKI
ncbi:30166_t:CDS:1, partial [Racocetra persica]